MGFVEPVNIKRLEWLQSYIHNYELQLDDTITDYSLYFMNNINPYRSSRHLDVDILDIYNAKTEDELSNAININEYMYKNTHIIKQINYQDNSNEYNELTAMYIWIYLSINRLNVSNITHYTSSVLNHIITEPHYLYNDISLCMFPSSISLSYMPYYRGQFLLEHKYQFIHLYDIHFTTFQYICNKYIKKDRDLRTVITIKQILKTEYNNSLKKANVYMQNLMAHYEVEKSDILYMIRILIYDTDITSFYMRIYKTHDANKFKQHHPIINKLIKIVEELRKEIINEYKKVYDFLQNNYGSIKSIGHLWGYVYTIYEEDVKKKLMFYMISNKYIKYEIIDNKEQVKCVFLDRCIAMDKTVRVNLKLCESYLEKETGMEVCLMNTSRAVNIGTCNIDFEKIKSNYDSYFYRKEHNIFNENDYNRFMLIPKEKLTWDRVSDVMFQLYKNKIVYDEEKKRIYLRDDEFLYKNASTIKQILMRDCHKEKYAHHFYVFSSDRTTHKKKLYYNYFDYNGIELVWKNIKLISTQNKEYLEKYKYDSVNRDLRLYFKDYNIFMDNKSFIVEENSMEDLNTNEQNHIPLYYNTLHELRKHKSFRTLSKSFLINKTQKIRNILQNRISKFIHKIYYEYETKYGNALYKKYVIAWAIVYHYTKIKINKHIPSIVNDTTLDILTENIVVNVNNKVTDKDGLKNQIINNNNNNQVLYDSDEDNYEYVFVKKLSYQENRELTNQFLMKCLNEIIDT